MAAGACACSCAKMPAPPLVVLTLTQPCRQGTLERQSGRRAVARPPPAWRRPPARLAPLDAPGGAWACRASRVSLAALAAAAKGSGGASRSLGCRGDGLTPVRFFCDNIFYFVFYKPTLQALYRCQSTFLAVSFGALLHIPGRLKMLFGLCCQRERLYKPLHIVQVFVLAGVAYYYFQESVGKPAPDHEIAGESAQPIGETLRPVWGLMDKCYPVTAQRRRVRSGKKQASEPVPPRATGGPNGAAEGETAVLCQREGAGRAPEAGAADPVAAGKEVAEEAAAAGMRGGEEDENVRKEIAMYRAEASEVEREEEGPGAWVPQLLKRLWLGWFPAPDARKPRNRE